MSGLKLDSPDARETCARLIAEQPHVAERRKSLLASQKKLLLAQQKLYELYSVLSWMKTVMFDFCITYHVLPPFVSSLQSFTGPQIATCCLLASLLYQKHCKIPRSFRKALQHPSLARSLGQLSLPWKRRNYLFNRKRPLLRQVIQMMYSTVRRYFKFISVPA